MTKANILEEVGLDLRVYRTSREVDFKTAISNIVDKKYFV